ncbi:hypothetical protein Tco_0396153 [Tanacetum coccineum]
MDDIVSSDKEWEEYGYGNPPNTTTDSFFKPYLKTQEKNDIEKEDERSQNKRKGNKSDLEINNENFHELDYELLIKLQDYWWKVNDHECSPFTNWRDHIRGPYSNYYSNAPDEEEQEDKEICELFDDPTQELPFYKIRSDAEITTTPSPTTTSSSPTPPNAPSKTPSTNQTSSSQDNTSSSFQSKLQISPPSSNEPTSPQPLNPLLENILDVPPRPLNPFSPLQYLLLWISLYHYLQSPSHLENLLCPPHHYHHHLNLPFIGISLY